MAEIAKWGRIRFKVNADKVFSFKGLKRTYSGKWSDHSIIGRKPKMEFCGANAQEISMEVILDAELGVNPRSELDKFVSAAEHGDIDYLYIGGRKICNNRLCIASGTDNWNTVWNNGELVSATASLTFSEYR
jgi:hypothetical protein